MSLLRLALESRAKKELLLLGEAHGDRHQMASVVVAIKQFRPDCLVHELVYDDAVLTIEELEDRIENSGKGELCDPNLNKDVYELALALKIPLIGCDLSDKQFKDLKGQSEAEVFAKREANMVRVIRSAGKNYNRVASVVGDAHLRTSDVEELGGVSRLVLAISKDDLGFDACSVKRVPKNKQEVE